MTRIVLVLLLVLPLFAGEINLNFSSEQLLSGQWNLTYGKNKTSMLMLPMDVNFTDIQNSLDTDGSLYVYTNEQTKDLLKLKFGVSFLGLVLIKKDKIVYAVIDDAGQHLFTNNFTALEEYLKNEIGGQIEDSTKKSLFLNSYIPYLKKIKANGLYKVLPKGKNFTFNVILPTRSGSSSSTSSESSSASSESSSASLEFPPDVTDI